MERRQDAADRRASAPPAALWLLLARGAYLYGAMHCIDERYGVMYFILVEEGQLGQLAPSSGETRRCWIQGEDFGQRIVVWWPPLSPTGMRNLPL